MEDWIPLETRTLRENVTDLIRQAIIDGFQEWEDESGFDATLGADVAAKVAYRRPDDVGADVASGSFRCDGVVICPASTGLLGRVATGASTNLLERMCEVALKEGRTLDIKRGSGGRITVELRDETDGKVSLDDVMRSLWALFKSRPDVGFDEAELLSALEEEGEALRGNRQRVYELVEQHMLPYIDFSYISRLVLGKNWRTATPQQRKDFIREFRQFLVRFYTAALLEYTKNHEIPKDVMVFLPLRDKVGGSKVTVSSEVRQPEKARPIPVNYLLRLEKDEWKIYDVVVDGVSLVANYRASFASYVRKEGIDGLIERLSQRNRQLADASM